MKTQINLNGLQLLVNLGWPQDERKKQQVVTLDVTLGFAAPPRGCVTDQLADTYCYDALITVIKQNLATRSFKLLEHLGHEIYHIIKQALSSDVMVNVRVSKRTAIENLTSGVTFCFGDN